MKNKKRWFWITSWLWRWGFKACVYDGRNVDRVFYYDSINEREQSSSTQIFESAGDSNPCHNSKETRNHHANKVQKGPYYYTSET